MIQINLLPGAKRSRGRAAKFDFSAFRDSFARVKDPYLLSAVVSVALAIAVVGGLHLTQMRRASSLAEQEQQALQDSTRYAAILKEKKRAEAQRDSIMRQLEIIRSIDNDRFVWPHVMEEVSRAMPPYTWLTSLIQTSEVVSVAAMVKADGAKTGAKEGAEGAAKAGAASAATAEPPAPAAVPVPPPMRFRIIGQTVDIQALTRLMKMLEASAFIQNVQLAKTLPVLVDQKEVTEFTLECEYEMPEPSVLQLVPVNLSAER